MTLLQEGNHLGFRLAQKLEMRLVYSLHDNFSMRHDSQCVAALQQPRLRATNISLGLPATAKDIFLEFEEQEKQKLTKFGSTDSKASRDAVSVPVLATQCQ